MNDDEILALMKEALSEVMPNRRGALEGVTLGASIEELDLDSVATMEVVGYLEEQIGALLPDEELAKIVTLGDLARLVREAR